MKLRPPSIPLITIDPYFSVWSPSEKLYDSDVEHWTASPNTIIGKVIIDSEDYRFMGRGDDTIIEQTRFNCGSLFSSYTFENDKITLDVTFFTPLFSDDMFRLSRPVSYVRLNYSSNDGFEHDVKVLFEASEELVLNKKGDCAVSFETIETDRVISGKIGRADQKILNRSGDDLRIEWGYFYLSAKKGCVISSEVRDNMTFVCCKSDLVENEADYVLFSYDDIYCLNYFGSNIEAYWKKVNSNIVSVIDDAFDEAELMFNKSIDFSEKMMTDAEVYGGEKYAEMLSLAYRQVIAAHKIAVDNNGEIVFISKECFSNGCAATVDVTYPSSPFFVLYNLELLKGMLRPIFKFAQSEDWQFDFAPHDVGQYPLVLGQVYGKDHEAEGRYLDYQMPVEECGNMLIMLANICLKENSTEFFDKYSSVCGKWVDYLIKYGMDPENQLCTDDFAGHLAHNCNLSLKAIMGIEGYSLILKIKNDHRAQEYHAIAKNMAECWVKNSANKNGSFRLTFDRPDTFSMKYNMIWDKIWNTELFPSYVYNSEFSSNVKHINAYGMPLDNRRTYTKSDWLVWTACLAPSKEDFEKFIAPLWNSYNVSPSRVPMTDWYDTVTSEMVGFRHRSVQGGLFIKLMLD